MKLIIKVKPGSKKSEIIEQENIAFLKAMPEKGKANEELVKLIKKHFKASGVRIVKGLKSREKILEIENGN